MNKNKRVWALVLSIVMFVSAWVSLISKFVSMGINHDHNHMTASRVNINQTTCDECDLVYNNGFCGCYLSAALQEPVLVTLENREALGLGEEYLNYRAITNAGELFWFSVHAIEDLSLEVCIDDYGVILNDISVNGTKDQTNVKNCGGNKQSGWIDFYQYLDDYDKTDQQYSQHMSLSHYVLDGRGHTISGVYHSGNTGLFGKIQPNPNSPSEEKNEIKNIGIVNSYFGGGGAFCGILIGNMTNCYSDSTVYGTSAILGTGGLIGLYEGGTIERCYNLGNVTCTTDFVGGLVGDWEFGIMKNCYNLGNVRCAPQNPTATTGFAGGLVGMFNMHSTSRLENSYSSATVETIQSEWNVGGLIGRFNAHVSQSPFYNLYYDCEKFNGVDIGEMGSRVEIPYDEWYTYPRTTEAFASGEIAVSLNGSISNGVWRQTIGEDLTPNFDGKFVYTTEIIDCDGQTIIDVKLSNENEKIVYSHEYELVETIDPIWDGETKIDGYKKYACKHNNLHTTKESISWRTLGSTITYDTNGGDLLASDLLKKGSIVNEFASPTRKGFIFIGWFKDEVLQTRVEHNYVIDEDITFYAKWVLCDHINNYNERKCEESVECSECNQELMPTGHIGEWEITKQPTEFERGEKKRVCEKCGKEEIIPIEKLEVKIDEDIEEKEEDYNPSETITLISTIIGIATASGTGIVVFITKTVKFVRKRKFKF